MLDLSRLSAEQRAVVLAPDGPMLVVAGPGSGKTTVLAGRIAALVSGRGVSPEAILALAFTTAAARELRERLGRILGEDGQRVDVGTFHAWGLRVVRHFAADLGYDERPVAVYDEADAHALLREAAALAGAPADGGDLCDLGRALERHRLGGAVDRDPEGLTELADAYEVLLRRRNAVDFPGMIALPLRLLRSDEGALSLCQDAYAHVLADECQDVCAGQYELLRLLAERHRNLVAVGDPWQSLYAWRGADGAVVDRLRADFPELRVLALSQNFRATGHLVELANALGAPLGRRHLWTTNPPGAPARLCGVSDERAEAALVADLVSRLLASGAVAGGQDVAVLYRTNRQAEAIALALRERGVAYRVRGEGDPFGRREVRDVLAYLRLALDPGDAAAAARVVNRPPRRLGRLADHLRQQPVPLHELPAVARDLKIAAAERVGELVALVDALHARAGEVPVPELLEAALERSGYRAWLEGQPDGAERLARLGRLRAAAARYRGDLASWLLAVQGDDEGALDAGEVVLATIHQAKGGEWAAVFLVGAEEGLLPHARTLDDREPDALRAELRLAYVAVTRARRWLWITHCRTRSTGGAPAPRRLSRFLRALPGELLAPGDRAA